MKYAEWKPVGTSLVRRSRKWRQISDRERVVWLHLHLISDSYGAIEGSDTTLWAIAGEPFGVSLQAFRSALSRLEGVGLIQRQTDSGGAEWTLICNYENMLTADMKRRRGKKVSPDPKKHHNYRVSGHKLDLVRSYSGVSPPLDRDRDRDRDRDKLTSSTTSQKLLSNKDSTLLQQDVRKVFDHWIAEEERTTSGGGLRPRILTEPRRKVIVARLREGYSVEHLCRAITHYCDDPWHRGDNDRQKRYTDLVTVLKSGSKVEQGLQQQVPQSEKEKRYERYADTNIRTITL